MSLTDIAIKGAKPKDKPYKLSDGGGLYLEVAPSGGKWWRYKFRFGGKELRLSLGTYPDVGLKDARARHAVERKKLSDGINPADNRKAEKTASKLAATNSFEVVAKEWAKSYFTNKTASHQERTMRRLESYIFPWLGNKAMSLDASLIDVSMKLFPTANYNRMKAAFKLHVGLDHDGLIPAFIAVTAGKVGDQTQAK